MKILHVIANPKATENSVSKQLAQAFFMRLIQALPDAEMDQIDLYNEPPPYLSKDAFRRFWQPVFEPGYQPTGEEVEASAYAEAKSKQLAEQDVVVLTAPLWNGGLPAILKAWIDQAMMPGILFHIEGEKMIPLHKIRRVVLLVSSGARLTENDPHDGLTPTVRGAFAFAGVRNISVAWADGQDPVAYSDFEERRGFAIEAAEDLAEEIAEEFSAATV